MEGDVCSVGDDTEGAVVVDLHEQKQRAIHKCYTDAHDVCIQRDAWCVAVWPFVCVRKGLQTCLTAVALSVFS